MKLHESPSPNARRVHIFLAEKGVDVERVPVDIRGGENLTPEYRAKNPAGKVPTLELDDGTCIAESVAICRYLEGLHPEPNLFGATPLEAATVEMWGRQAEINLMLNVAMAFRNISGFFKDREKCMPEWGQIAAERAAAAVDVFDDRLGKARFLAGDRFSVADITLGVTLDFAGMVKVELPQPPNIARYLGELRERPSWSAK